MAKNRKNDKNLFSVLRMKSAPLIRALDKMRVRYIAEGEPEDLIVPYILCCAMALEAKLNDKLLLHLNERWEGASTLLIEAYQSMSFRGKLNVIVPLLSGDKFRINTEHWVYRQLVSLISVRNILAHAKSKEEAEEVEFFTSIFWEKRALPKDATDIEILIGKKQIDGPLKYHEAFDKLDKWFFRRCPERLKHVEMVIPQREAVDKMDRTFVYAKNL
ncbi:hypothetical protein [Glaciimonas sp. PCH181]|uniref:hypothetical protein n=1 Tax=Glaciimonas sp. PCH181 TaxID=2133943 RepID=UPI0011B272D4|nr:hypothetical protein [Glaciimonas sp. PCH181]